MCGSLMLVLYAPSQIVTVAPYISAILHGIFVVSAISTDVSAIMPNVVPLMLNIAPLLMPHLCERRHR